jgi:hypothetical protein
MLELNLTVMHSEIRVAQGTIRVDAALITALIYLLIKLLH